ncbi:putative membrane protein [Rhizomicrobium palustre]|uniref:Putative membrane protein n=1 Tax=Rhizomicrobium palustre TaxID=189966 RepID=A0A846MXE2_9PROT|nr:hypothetical protein [Rhizomicrobium palustre]NIK87690.1 putative membrane protein [Rhizomicrobium palustre]
MADHAVNEQNPPVTTDSNRTLAIVAYILFLVGWPTLHMATIGGVILAYVQRGEARGTLWESHWEAIISTFWISLVIGLAALPLCLIGIGLLVYPVLVVWFLYRTIRGLVHALDYKPY